LRGLIHIPVFGMVLYFRGKTKTYMLVSFFLLSGGYKTEG
jgi:uncharacterized membrane protein